jgi:hypothetical protein
MSLTALKFILAALIALWLLSLALLVTEPRAWRRST